MPKPINVLTIVFLVIGLVVGIGIGSQAIPKTVMETQTQTITSTQINTLTQTLKEVLTKAETLTKTETCLTTSIKTETLTKITTVSKTESIFTTIIKKIYPTESETILLTDSGSGDKDTRPFTLNETADLKIIITIYPSAELKYVGLNWYLVPVGAKEYEAIKKGSVWEESGVIEFYAAAVPAGNYYLHIISANCKWTISVERVAEK